MMMMYTAHRKEEKLIRAVIYARYSSDRQTEQSIEGQIHVCSDFALRNNYVIVDTYIDRVMGGTNDNRDAFQRMISDSHKNLFDVVLVYKLDRFARNRLDSAVNKSVLKKNGVILLSSLSFILINYMKTMKCAENIKLFLFVLCRKY